GSLALVTGPAQAAPFTFLQSGFTQAVFAVSPTFLGGLAIAPDGDICADECAFSGSPMHRYDFQTTTTINGTPIHPNVAGSPFASNLGCGLCHHPRGHLQRHTAD